MSGKSWKSFTALLSAPGAKQYRTERPTNQLFADILNELEILPGECIVTMFRDSGTTVRMAGVVYTDKEVRHEYVKSAKV